MAIYPNSNLPSASQPWGREIQKNVENVTAQFLSERTNNTARDAQLEASYKRLNATSIATAAAVVTAQAAADAAQDAIDGLTSLGSAGSLYDIYADNISGGAITGVTFRTAASSTRIELSGTTMATYYGSTLVGYIYGDSEYSGSYKVVDSGGSNGLIIFNSQTLLRGPVGNVFINGSNLQINSSTSVNIVASSGTSVIGGLGVNGGLVGDTITSNGTTTSKGVLSVEGINSYIQCLDTYTRNVASGRLVYVSSIGTYNAAVSSAKYKQDIANYKIDLEKFLKLQPVTFRYKRAVQEEGDAAKVASGFIAEQADEIGLGEFVDYEPDPAQNGKIVPDNFRYIDFAAAFHSAISQQQDIIKALTSRIELLEGK